MKLATANVICVPKSKFNFALGHATCVLVGNGMDVNAATRRMVARVLKSNKRCVIDAAALRVLPVNLLHKNVILTPHAREFEAAFGVKANKENAVTMSKKVQVLSPVFGIPTKDLVVWKPLPYATKYPLVTSNDGGLPNSA